MRTDRTMIDWYISSAAAAGADWDWAGACSEPEGGARMARREGRVGWVGAR